MKSPCHKCLIKPSCRSKRFRILLGSCKIAYDYLWPKECNKGNKAGTILSIEKDLNPSTWYVSVDKPSGNASVVQKDANNSIIGSFYYGEYSYKSNEEIIRE